MGGLKILDIIYYHTDVGLHFFSNIYFFNNPNNRFLGENFSDFLELL